MDATPRVIEERRRAAPRPSARVRGDLGPEWGALSGVAANIGVTAAVHWKPARLELSGRWIGLRRTAGPGESELAVQLFAVALRGCYQLYTGAWEFPLCGGLEAGAVRIDRRRFVDESAAHGPWLAPLVAGAASRHFGRVGLWIEAQVAVRARGTTAGSGGREVFSAAAPVSLRPLLGIEIDLS